MGPRHAFGLANTTLQLEDRYLSPGPNAPVGSRNACGKLVPEHDRSHFN